MFENLMAMLIGIIIFGVGGILLLIFIVYFIGFVIAYNI